MRCVRTVCWILSALLGGFAGARHAAAAPRPVAASMPQASGLNVGSGLSLAAAGKKHSLESEHFLFVYDPDKVIDVATVQQSAEDAFRYQTNLFDYAPPGRIPVVLYANREEFQKEAGVNRTELVVGTASSADEAIRLDASKIFEAPDRVIGHEVTHIFLFQMLQRNIGDMPLWMNEGLAEVAGRADPDAAHDRVVGAMFRNRLLPLRNLALEFPKGEDAGLAYAESQEAVKMLLENGGWPKMRDLLGRLKRGDGFDAAFKAVYDMTAADWDNRWRNAVRVGARSQFWLQVAEWVIPALMFIALAWGVFTVRRHRRRQIIEETPEPEMEPPSWWREDDFKWR